LVYHIKGRTQIISTLETRVLRKLFGHKRDEATGGWRKLHNENLHNVYCSPNIIKLIKSRRMKWVEHVVLMDTKNEYKIFFRKSKGKRSLGRRRHRQEDNIKMDIKETGNLCCSWLK
jgi:hypothetical protein